MSAQRGLNWDVGIAVLAVALIVYIWQSSLVYLFIPWLSQSWEEYWGGWVVYLAVLHLVVIMIFWSFLATALTCPGEVPRDFAERVEEVGRGAVFWGGT